MYSEKLKKVTEECTRCKFYKKYLATPETNKYRLGNLRDKCQGCKLERRNPSIFKADIVVSALAVSDEFENYQNEIQQLQEQAQQLLLLIQQQQQQQQQIQQLETKQSKIKLNVGRKPTAYKRYSQAVLNLRLNEKKKIREIADILGMSTATVQKIINQLKSEGKL